MQFLSPEWKSVTGSNIRIVFIAESIIHLYLGYRGLIFSDHSNLREKEQQ